MLDYSEFTVVKNNEGNPTAMGIPINSMLLKNNTPLFMSGGGKGNKSNKGKKSKSNKKRNTKNVSKNNKTLHLIDNANFIEDGESYHDDIHEDLALPVGLACMTKTVCKKVDEFEVGHDNDNNNNNDHVHMELMNRSTELNEADDTDVVPDDLYERLIKLAEETTKPKKLSRRNTKPSKGEKKGKTRKNKTHKNKK